MKTQNNIHGIRLAIFKKGMLMMLFAFMTTALSAQTTTKKITGLVNSSFGPIPGATITLKGTSIGTYANNAGEFTFDQAFKENDILVISALGFEDTEVVITKDTTHIEPSLVDIEVIIIAALRTAPKEKLKEEKLNN